ncbi:nitroreductase family protein [Thermodesulfobacteriota bacterium]
MIEITEFTKLIKTRRSIHSWQNKPVTEEQLLQAIELATWAPNGSNRQSWRFHVIMNQAVIDSVADTIQSVMTRIRSWGQSAASPNDGTPEGRTIISGLPSETLRSAPALIVVASQKYENPRITDIKKQIKTDAEAHEAQAIIDGLKIVNPRVQSVAAAIAYLSLTLHQMGLGSLWATGPLQAKDAIEKVLNIPQDQDIMALVPVGYPAVNPVKNRKPVSEVCEIIR